MPRKMKTEEKPQSIDDLDSLRSYGVSSQMIERLRAVGVTSLKHLLLFNAEELMELLNLSELDTARKVIMAARELLEDEPRPMSARERVDSLSRQRVVRTGVEEFDKLVGGLRFGSSYEFAGEFGAGKTIMSLQIAVASVAQYGVGIVYIDTEKTLDAYLNGKLIENMCNRFGINYDEFLERDLVVYNPATVEELEDFVKIRLADLVVNGGVGVVIIDSVTALYRAQFRGREKLAERQQRLHYILDWIRRLTIKFGVLAIYTNQVMTMPSGYVEIKLPVGGNVLAHTVNSRWLMLRPSKAKPEGVMRALDVPGLAPGTEVEYTIADDGLH
ncbi:ATPase domain-containing protein [Vulcanisaeta sp. EB80]|uniref:ATPase domain-containing protein n=1 Tax=Vulcanisaeta sp. EB80 TaxID=1650660 RepID=UPI001EE4D785|nr:ATPase domain-containing protein [Vulcanisaeta sp. EB80]